MKIIRNGQGFELTREECNKIYDALDREYKIEDIRSKLEEMEVKFDDKDLNMLVDKTDRALGKNDSYWDSYWSVIEYIIDEYKEERL